MKVGDLYTYLVGRHGGFFIFTSILLKRYVHSDLRFGNEQEFITTDLSLTIMILAIGILTSQVVNSPSLCLQLLPSSSSRRAVRTECRVVFLPAWG